MSTRRQSSSGLVVGTTKFGQAYGKIRQVLVFRILEKNRVALALQPRFRTGARGFLPTPRSAPGITRFTHVVPTGQSPNEVRKVRSLLFHTGFAFQQVHRRLREERQADQHHRLRRVGAAVVSRQGGLLVGGSCLLGYLVRQEKCARAVKDGRDGRCMIRIGISR